MTMADEDRQEAAYKGRGTGRLIPVGSISKAHGIRGEVVIRYPRGASAVPSAESLFLPISSGYKRVAIERIRQKDETASIVKFAGIDDRTAAEAMAGMPVFQDTSQLPPLGDDEYYLADLEGLDVVDGGGSSLGRVWGVLEAGRDAGGHDSLIVRDGDSEFMIPFIDEMVVDVDLEGGFIQVELPDGLKEATSSPLKHRLKDRSCRKGSRRRGRKRELP